MDFYVLSQQIVNGLVLGSTYGLIAVGYTMVYGIIGMINFAHGEVYMVSAYLTAIGLAVLAYFGISNPWLLIGLTMVFAIVFTSLLGVTIERLAYRPLRRANRLAPLISAIGVSLILQNYVQLSQGAKNQGVPTLVEGVFRMGSEDHFFQITYMQMVIIIVAILAMAILNFVVQHTALGRACRATQQDRQMAQILGIDTDKVIALVFGIGAALAAVAGVLITLNYGSFDFFVGFVTGVKAFTAAVLGGIGSLPGAMLGGILLGLAESLFAGFVSSDYKDVFAFALLVGILIFRPSGLLGKPTVEKV